MKRIHKIFQGADKVESLVCIFLLVIMCFIVIAQVFSRYLFNYSFVWAEELVRYLMIWMVMVGAALVQSKNDHIRIDFFPMLAGPRGRRVMEIVFSLCALFFLGIILLKGIKMAYFNRLFESSGLRISMLWPFLSIPLGALLIGIYTIHTLIKDSRQLFFWPVEKLKELDDRFAMEKYGDTPMPQDQDLSHKG